MDERFQFWTNQGSWPDDAYGFVFLARAVQQIGRATFPDEWTGREAIAEPPIETPYEAVLRGVGGAAWSRWQEDYSRQVMRLIAARDPSKLCWIETKIGNLSVRTNKITTASMRYGESLIPEENQRRTQAKERWERVVSIVKSALRDGSLESVTLPTHGGAFSAPRPKEWWNVSGIEARLTMCRLNPENPFSAGFAGRGYEHIFVKASSLARLLPVSRPTTSHEVKSLESLAEQLYDQILEERGRISHRVFMDACKNHIPEIKTPISRPVYKRKNSEGGKRNKGAKATQ